MLCAVESIICVGWLPYGRIADMIREPHYALDTVDSHVKFVEIPVLIISYYFVTHMEHQIHVVKSMSANTERNRYLF